MSNHRVSNEVWVRQLCGVSRDKEFCRPVFNDFFQFLYSELVVVLKFLFSFIDAHNNINKMPIYAELHKRPEPLQGVQHHTREGLNIPPKLQVVVMKYYV
jgi:hypothetical protein